MEACSTSFYHVLKLPEFIGTVNVAQLLPQLMYTAFRKVHVDSFHTAFPYLRIQRDLIAFKHGPYQFNARSCIAP